MAFDQDDVTRVSSRDSAVRLDQLGAAADPCRYGMAMAVEPVDRPDVPGRARGDHRGRAPPARPDGQQLLPLPRHGPRRRGRVLRDPVAAAAGVRARRHHRLHRPAVPGRPGGRPQEPGHRPRVAGPDTGHRRRRSSPRRWTTSCGWPSRRHLDRLRARPVVRLPRAQRLHRHHLDHVRVRRPPQHRQDPGLVVHPLRRGAADRHRSRAAGAGRPGRGGRRRARPRRVPAQAPTGRRCSCSRSGS